MGRCLAVALLTGASFIVLAVAIRFQAWLLVVVLLLAYCLWFYTMGRPTQ